MKQKTIDQLGGGISLCESDGVEVTKEKIMRFVDGMMHTCEFMINSYNSQWNEADERIKTDLKWIKPVVTYLRGQLVAYGLIKAFIENDSMNMSFMKEESFTPHM